MKPELRKPDPDDSGDHPDGRVLLAAGIVVFLSGAACGAMLYAFGIAGRQFDVSVLRGGLLTFGITALCVASGVVLMTLLIQALGFFWPRSLTIWSELRLLRRARKKTLGLLDRKRTRQEERARLTAKMQATYLLEKESARVANQQSLRELRSALQVSAIRSCELVYEHLNRTVDQYQELVQDIESSPLPPSEKTELLTALNAKLTEDTERDRKRSAQSIMESAIWEIRFRKARSLARRKADAAVAYLKSIRQRTDSHRILLQIDALIRELSSPA